MSNQIKQFHWKECQTLTFMWSDYKLYTSNQPKKWLGSGAVNIHEYYHMKRFFIH